MQPAAMRLFRHVIEINCAQLFALVIKNKRMRFIIHNAEKSSNGNIQTTSADGYPGINKDTGAGRKYVTRTTGQIE
jgi:hypothetical protein